jgi:predicted PurR-regulated permease PerM
MERLLQVNITLRTILMVVVVLLSLGLLYLLRDLLLTILAAVVLASSVEPAIVALNKRRIPRALAAFFVFLLIIGTFGVLTFLFIPPILNETGAFISALPQFLGPVSLPDAFSKATALGAEAVQSGRIQDVVAALQAAFSTATGGVAQAVSSVLGGFFQVLLIILLSYYFAVRETGIDDFLRVLTPVKHRAYVIDLWRRAQHKIGLWMQGQLLLSLIIAVLLYLGLTILGVPYALLLALFAALFELIPVVGSLIAALPGVVIAFADGGVSLALLTAGLYLIVNQFQSNLIYPLVVKKVVGVPPVLVIIALIAGAQLAGVLGIILAVPVAAALQELVSDIEKRRLLKSEEIG